MMVFESKSFLRKNQTSEKSQARIKTVIYRLDRKNIRMTYNEHINVNKRSNSNYANHIDDESI